VTEHVVRRARAVQRLTKEAANAVDGDLRAFVRVDLERELSWLTKNAVWKADPVFDEQEVSELQPVYADDANWDDDGNPPEPIGHEWVDVILISATQEVAF